MAFIQYEITEYRVVLTSYQTGSTIGTSTIVAAIECQEPNANRCLVYFIADDEPLPPNMYNAEEKAFACYHHGKRFPWFVDILRNEKPVKCRIFTDYLQSSGIECGFEPVGDGEKKQLIWRYGIIPI